VTKNQVIEALFLGNNFNDCIGKMEPAHLREDLKMEVIAVVCEWPEEKVLELYWGGKLEFYVVRVIINMLSNKYSPFFKKFRVQTLQLTNMEIAEHYDYEERFKRESQEDKALGEIDNLPWYNAGLLKLYIEKGNYRAIEQATGIPHSSCYKTIQKSMKDIKLKIAL
jgi:hypothetical protein